MLMRTDRMVQELQQIRGAAADRKRERDLQRAVAARLAIAANTLLDHAVAPGTSAAERTAFLLAAGTTLGQVQVLSPAVEATLERLEKLHQASASALQPGPGSRPGD